MSIVDPVFPFPEPSFLFVHTVNLAPAPITVDDDGYVQPSTDPGVPVIGYVTNADPSLTDTQGVLVNTVVLVPRATVVDHDQEIVVQSQAGLHPSLVGRYAIREVRPNASHIRLLAMRVADPTADVPVAP